LLWYASHLNVSYDFDPPNSRFTWQHGPNWTSDGTLLVSTSMHPVYPWDNIGMREYIVDHDTQTLTEIWNMEFNGRVSYGGDAHRLSNGNTLQNYGSSGLVQEIGPNGTVHWVATWADRHLLGMTTFLDDLYRFAP